jgi:heme oxygenase (biliverdin-producing, ferredoxin)
MPAPLAAYINRIESLSASEDPSPLLAHSYVRYLGDLSGGQTIRRTIGKAYNLDEASHEGLEFYAFKELTTNKPANQGEMKRIKDWFREGMNAAGKLGKEVKGTRLSIFFHHKALFLTTLTAQIVEEANRAFALNTDLFTALCDTASHLEEKAATVIKDFSEAVEQPLDTAKTYPVSQVIAFIAASESYSTHMRAYHNYR